MFTKGGLLAFRDWGQHSLEAMLDHVAKLPRDALLKPLDGFGWAKLRDQLLHMASAEAFWVTSAQGKVWGGWQFSGAQDAETIREAFCSAFTMTQEFVESLNEDELLLPRRVVFSDGSIDINPVLMVHHIITHHFHHKGQVVAMCRLLGHPAPETDLDVVVRSK